jgi:hypothetical protein
MWKIEKEDSNFNLQSCSSEITTADTWPISYRQYSFAARGETVYVVIVVIHPLQASHSPFSI